MMDDYDFNAFAGGDDYSRRYQAKYAAMFTPGQRVLDLGCGSGAFLGLLRERGVHGLGVDSSGRMAGICAAKGLEAVHSGLEDFLDRCTDRYDGVFCSHIVEHLAPQDLMALLHAIHAALVDAGRLIIITPTFRDPIVGGEYFWLDVTHVRPYPEALLRQMLATAGFDVTMAGLDRDTRRRMPRRNPWRALAFLIERIRHGRNYGCGDTVVIATRA